MAKANAKKKLQFWGTGRRKKAIARVRLIPSGSGAIVINSDKAVLTGKKLENKFYRYHTGYIGGLKEIAYGKMMAERSDLVVYEAVRGMLPKNSLGRQMIKKLRVYKGAEHNHAAQKPEELKLF